MQKRIFTFGEIMLRISPSAKGERIEKATLFRIEPGGSESNVAVALAQLGHKVNFLTKIPDNLFKNLIVRYLGKYAIDPSYISIGGERIGIYWTEDGIGPRSSRVIYDREKSSFFDFNVKDFNWHKVNKEAFWFHTSGITPAISKSSCQNLFSIVNNLDRNIRISIDINYRNKLWRWVRKEKKRKIKHIMDKLCRKAYLITANENDFQDAFGHFGEIYDIETYKKIAKNFFHNIKSLKFIAISLRTSYSASKNDWNGVLLVRDGKNIKQFIGPKYELSNIVDRVGTGDSFTAGIIHGILKFKRDYQHVIDFATTLAALNHTVRGDASQFGQKDVEETLASKGTGRIIR